MIVPGSASQALAASLARERDEPLATAEYSRFPDGETLAAVPDFEGDVATVVAATPTNDAHVQLLQLQDAVRAAGATEVTTVLPYMGYARQDRAFKPGHPVSARAVARAISTGADRVVIVNPHEDSIADFFEVPCEVVDASARLAEPLPGDLSDPLFLSPDAGAIGIAETVRDAYGRGHVDYFEKERDYDTGEVEVRPRDAPVEGRDAIIVDDIVATGSTMSESVDVLRQRGADRVYAACVHPVLAGSAQTKLAAAGIEAVYGTDTIERAISRVSVAPVLASRL